MTGHETIVAAALCRNGLIYTMPKRARHGDIIRYVDVNHGAEQFVSDMALCALSGKYPKHVEFYKTFWERDHNRCGFYAPIGTPGYFERMNGPWKR